MCYLLGITGLFKLTFKKISEQFLGIKRGRGEDSRMRKGGTRGPAAPQPGFAFAANPELNFRDVGEAEVRSLFFEAVFK